MRTHTMKTGGQHHALHVVLDNNVCVGGATTQRERTLFSSGMLSPHSVCGWLLPWL